MNRKKRMKNRATAEWLRHQQPCTRCNTPGLHFVVTDALTMQDVIDGTMDRETGFWTCPDLYGPDGVRLAA